MALFVLIWILQAITSHVNERTEEADARERLTLLNELIANFECPEFAVMPNEQVVLRKAERNLRARIELSARQLKSAQ